MVSPEHNLFLLVTFFQNTCFLKTDFSILKLEKKAKPSFKVGYICLPESSYLDFNKTELTISGWGRTANGGVTSNVLKVATIYGISNEECQAKYVEFANLTDKMLCAAKQGTDTCQGDSGGTSLILTYFLSFARCYRQPHSRLFEDYIKTKLSLEI